MVAGREVVAELVRAQDREQGERERDAVQQPQGPEERVEGHERERAVDQAAGGQGREHGQDEQEQVDARPGRLADVGQRHRADPDQVALSPEERGEPEGLEARLDQGEGPGRLHQQGPAPREGDPADLLPLDAEDVLYVPPQQILDHREALDRRAIDFGRRRLKRPESHG